MNAPLTSPAAAKLWPIPLEIDSLVRRFGQVTAVDGISLELRAGECFGLLGPNGAGKSTLIRCIVGRAIPDAGRVSVFGSQAGSVDARAALGWIPQELALYPRLTCKENLAAFGRYHGLSGDKLRESVAWCLDWAALADRAGDLEKNLSGGMKRRLNMAAGIIHRPRIVLMDEPTVGVDPQSRNRIFEMIENITPGAGGELQLTDAIKALLQHEKVYGYSYVGKRHDAGDKQGFLRATVELGLKHPKLGADLRTWLKAQTF